MSRVPESEEKRGSRAWILGRGTTCRFRLTAFLEESSAGACLEDREVSVDCAFLLPALRSSASWKGEGDLVESFVAGASVVCLPRLRLRLRLSDLWAVARAPKAMDDSASLAFAFSDSDCSCYRH